MIRFSDIGDMVQTLSMLEAIKINSSKCNY